MFRSYFKIAKRHLFRNLSYTLINVVGLAIGVGVCLLIFVYIHFETTFDDFHPNKERIFRVVTENRNSVDSILGYSNEVPLPLPKIIKSDMPELQRSAGVYCSQNDQLFVLNESGEVEKKFREVSGLFYLEPSFFDIFSFKWLAGGPNSSLQQPNSIVLSKETANRYFGDWSKAMGRDIRLNNEFLLTVTGILEDAPANTDFQLKAVVPFGLSWTLKYPNWAFTNSRLGCFVLLPPNERTGTATARLRALSKKYSTGTGGDTKVLVFQPISDIHYWRGPIQTDNFIQQVVTRGEIRVWWIAAISVLFIGCINFINLSTSQFGRRGREIGVQKVLGSNSPMLRRQFLVETFLVVVMAVALGAIFSIFAIGPVGKLLDVPLSADLLMEQGTILFLFVVAILTTLLAGLYPSVVLSRFNPIHVLKSNQGASPGKVKILRQGLIVFQFVITQVIIIGMLVFVKQMDYFRNGSMGFNKDAVIAVPIPQKESDRSKYGFLRSRINGIPGVRSATFCSSPPATLDNSWDNVHLEGHAQQGEGLPVITKFSDSAYLRTYGLPLEAGRNFSSDTAHEFLITRELMGLLGYKNPAEALGGRIRVGDNLAGDRIVGVLSDFHATTFHDNYLPVLIAPSRNNGFSFVGIKLEPANMPATLRAIESLWNNTYPDFVFEYHFMNDTIAQFYKEENKQTQLCKIIAGIAIFLSCLGLYGLISFVAAQRIREIAIRKVLGASSKRIALTFIKDFVSLICIAFLVATPVGWYFMKRWLENYVFRVDVSWWIFLLSGGTAILITVLTIGYTAVRTARANPVKNLRAD
ncbi:MAG TPA: FtsX-like permease family protein [Puia sp.]|jgi:ABC-type lipoprotein release transport system permease subunit|nr:FtsX-like permease family protein [Puia sp.]